MNTERFRHRITSSYSHYSFWGTFWFIILVYVVLCLGESRAVNGEFDFSKVLYDKDIFHYSIALSPVLFIFCFFALLIQIKKDTRKRVHFNFFVHPEKYLNYTIEFGLLITLLVISLSVILSFFLLDKSSDDLRQFFANSSFINMFASFFIGIWGLLITIIVMRQQKHEILGFRRFLEEATLILENVKLRVVEDDAVLKVYIVDFHPFVGSRSLGVNKAQFKNYISELFRIACNPQIELIIVCHSDKNIINKFSNKKIIKLDLTHEPLSISDALTKLAQQNLVTIWRSDEIGPYHFIIAGDEAIEYIVIPFDAIVNENQLIATKVVDKSRVDYLERTAKDIVSAAIKPLVTDFHQIEITQIPIKLEFNPLQANIVDIKLRFQFEEFINEEQSVINFKKGFYPEPHDEYFIFNEDNLLFSETTNAITKIFYQVIKNNGSIEKNELLHYDNETVYFQGRSISRRIIEDRVYLKVKFRNRNETETSYSHKVHLKIW